MEIWRGTVPMYMAPSAFLAISPLRETGLDRTRRLQAYFDLRMVCGRWTSTATSDGARPTHGAHLDLGGIFQWRAIGTTRGARKLAFFDLFLLSGPWTLTAICSGVRRTPPAL